MTTLTNYKIGVVGSGAMGSGIAQVAATAGHKVVLFDTNAEALQKASSGLNKSLQTLVEKGKLTQDKANGIKENTLHAEQLSSLSDCDLIIEAIIEDINVKQKLFSDLEALVKPACLLASNTSSLSIAAIGAACKDPSRVVGIHFFNPATIMPLVEIIPAITTSSETLNISKQLIDSWSKVTVVAKDSPGFIVNRVARSFYGESIRIYEEGIADLATIDWALKEFGGFKMGPFELMDFIGNDVNYKVTESVWQQFFYDPRFKPSLTQKRLFEARLFGRKAGKGYYDYSKEMPLPVKEAALGKAIFDRVICMLVNEAVDSLYLQLASKQDIDLAMTKGVNYPKGLLAWGGEIGWKTIYSTLNNLYTEYCEDRYRPCVLLKRLSNGQTTL